MHRKKIFSEVIHSSYLNCQLNFYKIPLPFEGAFMYKFHNKIKLGWFEAQINIIEHTILIIFV